MRKVIYSRRRRETNHLSFHQGVQDTHMLTHACKY
jgi:hypothetical protein